MIFLFRSNTYSFYDNYLISQPKTGEFYSISDYFSSISPFSSDGTIGYVSIYLDNQAVHHERRVYNLYEMIGDIGGISQVILTLFMLALNQYTGPLFFFSFVNRLFQKPAQGKVLPVSQQGTQLINEQQFKKSSNNEMKTIQTLDRLSRNRNQSLFSKINWAKDKRAMQKADLQSISVQRKVNQEDI